MKKLMMMLLLVATATTAFSQSAKFGIKGGLNYGSTGELSSVGTSIDADNKVGYHLGILTQFKVLGIFVQPEVVYTRLNTEYSDNGATADYNLSKIDVPLLAGLNIAGPLNIKAGPAFQLVLNNELDSRDLSDVDDVENTFTVGYQLGVGAQLGKLGLDLRYEGAFQDNDAISPAQDETNTTFVVDSRPSQFILSLSYMLDGKK